MITYQNLQLLKRTDSHLKRTIEALNFQKTDIRQWPSIVQLDTWYTESNRETQKTNPRHLLTIQTKTHPTPNLRCKIKGDAHQPPQHSPQTPASYQQRGTMTANPTNPNPHQRCDEPSESTHHQTLT